MRLREALIAGCLAAALAGPTRAQAPTAPPTPEQIKAATEAVYNDPLRYRLKAERELRFKSRDRPEPVRDDAGWWQDFVHWFIEAGRWLVWLLGALAVALLALYLVRWMKVRGDAVAGRALALPSHVRDLDIRPESLPADLPAEVRALWQRGEVRAALSLLYRGALSRMVHDHGVPVRGASTEGECEQLASHHLDAPGSDFVSRLVVLWQLAVYGARLPDSAAVLALCDDFESRLPRRALAAPASGSGARA